MKVEQIEKLIIGDKYHLLRDKQKESYLLYQAKRLGLFIKNLTTKETEDEWSSKPNHSRILVSKILGSRPWERRSFRAGCKRIWRE